MKILILILSFIFSFSTLAGFTDADKAQLALWNLYTNSGLEQGKVGWSTTGGGAIALETTTKRSGKASIKFTSSTATDTLNFPSVTVKKGTNNCESTFWYNTTSTDFTANVYYSTDLIATQALPAVTEWTKATLTFTCPINASANVTKITGAANTHIIYVDDAYIGENRNIGSVNLQEKQYDISSYISSTNFTVTLGSAIYYKDRSNPSKNRLRFNISGLYNPATNSGSIDFSGVTFKQTANFYQAVTGGGGNDYVQGYVGPDDNDLHWAAGSNIGYIRFSGDVELNSKPTWATDYASEQVVRAEVANQSGTSRNTGDSVSDITSATYVTHADASFSTRVNSGIAENPSTATQAAFKVSNLRPGRYKVRAVGSMGVYTSGSASTICFHAITDGTQTSTGIKTWVKDLTDQAYASSIEGTFEYTSLQSSVTFSLQAKRTYGDGVCRLSTSANGFEMSIEPIYPTVAMPQIVNSVGTSYNGQTRLESVTVAGAGSDNSSCGTGACTLWHNTGGISSVSRTNTARYTVNFNTGVFSDTPNCTCTIDTGPSNANVCYIGSCTNTSCLVTANNLVNGYIDNNKFYLICHGIK